jgi:predicted N-acetyltransferase YhbS
MAVEIRVAKPRDTDACARICFEAFKGIAERGGYPLDFPSTAYSHAVIETMIRRSQVFGVVAERKGRVVGSNFLDERDAIRGVGPISVDPASQGGGVGRLLMEAVLERGSDAEGVRLLQDAHNSVSLSLYTSLGLAVKEPIVLLSGTPKSASREGVDVRPIHRDDLAACADLCRRVHGLDRTNSLAEGLDHFSGHVALRDGRIVAYCSALSVWPVAHGVAETEQDMRALISGAASSEPTPLSFLVPTRAELFGWCIEEGLRVVKSMNLMAVGAYQEPRGAGVPSVLY